MADSAEVKQGPARRLSRSLALGGVVTVVVLAAGFVVGGALWTGPPSEDELREQAGLTGESELLIGVKDDIPGIAFQDPKTKRYEGFDIDMAYMIAADLGFQPAEVHFLTIEDEDRHKMRASDGNRHRTVDLVIAHYSFTKDREDDDLVSFSKPYLSTEQSVMTRRDHDSVQHLSDLEGEEVCAVSTSTSVEPADDEGLDVRPRSNYAECLRGLENGTFDAITSDAAILGGFVAANPRRFELHDIGLTAVEQWAVNTGGNEALRTLVNLSLLCSLQADDRTWENAYEEHLRPSQQARGQDVAIDRQPKVGEVAVRQWRC